MEKALESEDCISRKAVLTLVKIGGKYNHYTDSFITYDGKSLYETIKDMPSMEPKQKIGCWIHTEECNEEWQYRCSKCNMPSRSNLHRYCSNCGCYMYGIKAECEEVREWKKRFR